MPQIPEPKGASPDLMPFLRWVRDTLRGMIDEQSRQLLSDSNTNSSQNSTMSVLVDRLGTVEAIMDSIGSSLTIDSSQVVSGTLDGARIPNLDASKITSGTMARPVNTSGDVTAVGNGTFNAAWNYDTTAVTRRAVWMDSSGRLGQTASSDVYKENIEPYEVSEAALRLLKVVSFNWKRDMGPNWHHREVGILAQQAHNLGLRWLVDYEADGKTIHGFHYDRLGLATLPLVQRLAKENDELKARLEAIEARLGALEAAPSVD